MVGSIVPIVNGQYAKHLLWGTLPLYFLGSVSSAAIFGLALGLLGALLNRLDNAFAGIPTLHGSWVWGFLALLCLGYALHELRLFKMPTPQIKRQVPQRWLGQFHPFVTWLLFGLNLGVGVTTYIPVGTFYIVLLAALFGQNPLYAMALMGVFGLGRAMTTLILLVTPLWGSRGEAVSKLRRVEEQMHVINGTILAAVSALLFGHYIL